MTSHSNHNYSITSGVRGSIVGYWFNNIGSIDSGETFTLPNGNTGTIRQTMRLNSLLRIVFAGSGLGTGAADQFPDTISCDFNGAVSEWGSPTSPAVFGQGTGRDYTLQSGTDPFAVANRSIAVRLVYFDAPSDVAPSFASGTGPRITGVAGTAIPNVVVPAATGTPDPVYTASGLPNGLAFNANTRTISGTPAAAGTGTITITATNSAGSATRTYSFAFTAPPTPDPDPKPPVVVTGKAIYTAPTVSQDTQVTVRCTITVRGTGKRGADGASASVSQLDTFTVRDVDRASGLGQRWRIPQPHLMGVLT